MKGLPFVLLFTVMTFVSWGAYGPVLHHGRTAFDGDSLRAFVGVGLAYFLIAVIFPAIWLRKGGEQGNWTLTGSIYSLIAGAVGAIGALGIILALAYGGRPVYVMPLVFGFAPVVNTLVTAMLSRTFNQISPVFIGGIIAAALGAGGVLIFKPSPASTAHAADSEPAESLASEGHDAHAPATKSPLNAEEGVAAAESDVSAEDVSTDSDELDGESADSDNTPETADGDNTEAATDPTDNRSEISANSTGDAVSPKTNWPGIILSIITAALCWGAYGPMLHIGQAKMSGSRLRPFACVGLSYFFIAVAAPLALIYLADQSTGSWTAMGMTWSFLAGVAGAIGALGVILAFNAGGKPYYVMPLIFGFAPVINTFISLSETGLWGQVDWRFWISLGVVIVGAVTVLINAPRPQKAPPPAAPAA